MRKRIREYKNRWDKYNNHLLLCKQWTRIKIELNTNKQRRSEKPNKSKRHLWSKVGGSINS